jgi:hypothetical protein
MEESKKTVFERGDAQTIAAVACDGLDTKPLQPRDRRGRSNHPVGRTNLTDSL